MTITLLWKQFSKQRKKIFIKTCAILIVNPDKYTNIILLCIFYLCLKVKCFKCEMNICAFCFENKCLFKSTILLLY